MTLRTRIALVAAMAVALTVVAVAVTNYAATRSELRGQVDQALRERLRPITDRGAPEGPGPPPRSSPPRGGMPMPSPGSKRRLTGIARARSESSTSPRSWERTAT